MEDQDCDVDVNLLQQLLENAEKEDEASRQNETTNLQSKPSFDQLLESLDSIPVRSARKLQDITAKEVNKSSNASSVLHTGDTDSSDDEDNKHLERKYNEFGQDVKRILQNVEESKNDRLRLTDGKRSNATTSSWNSSTSQSGPSSKTLCLPDKKKQVSIDVYTEPLIGIRIVKPLVSSEVLKARLVGRKIVHMDEIQRFLNNGKVTTDWVIFAVIVSKSPPKTSAKGSTYSILRLCDLRGPGDLKTVSLFLFSKAFKEHNKNSVGTVIGVLNPGVLDNSKNHGDEACISVDNPDKITILGTSKDFGTCKSKKKNGENCTSIVNTAQCEFCVYHIKQEYQKCSRRSDLQSSFNGFGLTGLRNKVLGKNEVFYGGQSFTAIPAKRSKKLTEKDDRRLKILSGQLPGGPAPSLANPPGKSRLATSLDLSHRQVHKDMVRLQRLRGETTDGPKSATTIPKFKPDVIKPDEAKCAALALIESKKASNSEECDSIASSSPKEDERKLLTEEPAGNFSLTDKGNTAGVNSLPPFNNKSTATTQKTTTLLKKTDTTSKEKSFDDSKPTKVLTPSHQGKDQVKSSSKLQRNSSNKLDSKTLLKLATNGNDLESRLFKQAANKAKEEEEISKFDPKSTPSQWGLGRRSQPPIAQKTSLLNSSRPVLGLGLSSSSKIDLTAPLNKNYSKIAKMNAISMIQKGGGLKKEDPNNREFERRKKLTTGGEKVTKRVAAEPAGLFINTSTKKVKLSEEDRAAKMAKFKEIMEMGSNHQDLIEAAENKAQDQYFDKLETKEKLEEKMLNTFKVACKAVRCLTCKYTSFSASEMCKAERHPLKVFDATKRFWKCGDCGNRTVSLEILPLFACKNCGSSKWERAAMIRERKIGVTQETLSVRGLEEKFVGSVATGGNLNLLVPE